MAAVSLIAVRPTIGELGIDESWTKISPGALVGAGFHIVCCYLSTDPTKNWTRAYWEDCLAAGLGVVLNAETIAQMVLGNDAVQLAELFNAQADALGAPDSLPIIWSTDFDIPTSQMAQNRSYLAQAATVKRPSAPYGKAALLDYLGIPGWQSVAWSGSAISVHAELYQRVGHTVLIPGYPSNSYDEDVLLTTTPTLVHWAAGVIPPAVVTPPPVVTSNPPKTFPPIGALNMPAVPFTCQTDASGHVDVAIPLPAGTTRVVDASVDLLSVYAKTPAAWDSPASASPAVGNPGLKAGTGEVVVSGLPLHMYTGHAICA